MCQSTAACVKVHASPVRCSKSSAHDEEVRKLYEEMEQQIKVEKERILNEVSYPARALTTQDVIVMGETQFMYPICCYSV